MYFFINIIAHKMYVHNREWEFSNIMLSLYKDYNFVAWSIHSLKRHQHNQAGNLSQLLLITHNSNPEMPIKMQDNLVPSDLKLYQSILIFILPCIKKFLLGDEFASLITIKYLKVQFHQATTASNHQLISLTSQPIKPLLQHQNHTKCGI